MESFTILIPSMRPPFSHGIEIIQFKNIIKEIGKKFNVKPIWVIFQPDKIEHEKTSDYEIIYYDNYKNALEILEEKNPDLILFDGDLTCYSISFALAGKFKNIPVVTTFFVTESENNPNFLWAKSRLRILFGNGLMRDEGSANTNKEMDPKKFKMLSFGLSEYRFLLRTLKKINYSNFDLLRFMLFFPRFQIFSEQDTVKHPLASGVLNLCSTPKIVKKLKNAGFLDTTIFLCGNPYFDNLFLKRRDYSNKLNNPKTRILFCTSSLHEHGMWSKQKEDNFVINIIKNISENKANEIALKIHPSTSSRKEYEELLQTNNLNITLYQKEDFVTLLAEYDIVICYGQTTAILEGILLNKKIIFIDFFNEHNLNQFFDESVMTYCSKLNDLDTKIQTSLEKIISKDRYQKYIEKHIGRFDGNCSTLAANEILKICNKKN